MGWAVPQITVYLTFYLLAFLPYLAAICLVLLRKPHKASLPIIIAISLALRLPHLSGWAPISTDIYRYRWDGKMQHYGLIPYLYAPDAPELERYRDRLWKRINNKHVKTIYPPASETLFWLCYKLDPKSALPFKASFLLFDLLSIGAIIGLLRRLGLPAERCLIYAWSPLVIDAFAINAHQDSLGIFGMLLALNFSLQGRNCGAGLSLCLSVMSKGAPILLLPAFVKRSGWRLLLWLALGIVLFLAPYAGAGARITGGLGAFTSHWHKNAGLYDLLMLALRPLPKEDVLARSIAGAIVLYIAFFFAPKISGSDRGLLRATFWIIGAFLLLSPAVFPWYLCWLLPLLCFRLLWGWLLLTALVGICYVTYAASPLHQAYYGLMVLEYLPVFSLMLWEVRRDLRRLLLQPIKF